MDGLTVVATYKNGHLKQAVTRGNGLVGEDITHNAPFIKGLSSAIPENVPREKFISQRLPS